MDEALALLLLPGQLEGLAMEAHARDLLAIPRVIALEPSRFRTPRVMRDSAAARQAARLRLPGALRLVALYHPAQYPLARAVCSTYEQAELWYIAPDHEALPAAGSAEAGELASFDQLARDRASCTLNVSGETVVEGETLRARLRELDVISPRGFIPAARFTTTLLRKGSRPPR